MKPIKDLFKAHYDFYNECFTDERTKYAWAATEIFDLTTYDSDLDELFVDSIMEVCSVILNGKSFDYIVDKENYIKYILVCQLLDKLHWIEWGSSIRGAWFEEYQGPYDEDRYIVDKVEWKKYVNPGEWEDHELEAIPFTIKNLIAWIDFMIEE